MATTRAPINLDEAGIDRLKDRAAAEVDARRDELVELSLRIHSHPETGFQEEQAARWLTDYLEAASFDVTRGYCELPTAFRADAGNGEHRVAFLAEYDALPVIGHGCGHNIIATSAVGAGVALKSVLPELGGRLSVIGTPAEEVYGGKVIMARRGAFEGLTAAMLTHPGVRNAVMARALACAEVTVEYFGREAHAAARPQAGVNALDAMVIAYMAIAALRQHVRDSARVHGVITDGGSAPNVVPGHASGRFLVRATDMAYLAELKDRVQACFEAGARATGARLETRWNENEYAPMYTNVPLAEAHRRNLIRIGRRVPAREQQRSMGSTDMGNVSMIAPAIHPGIAVAPREVSAHTPDFARYAAQEEGHRALIDAAKAMAMTMIDVLARPDLRRRLANDFARQSKSPR